MIVAIDNEVSEGWTRRIVGWDCGGDFYEDGSDFFGDGDKKVDSFVWMLMMTL